MARASGPYLNTQISHELHELLSEVVRHSPLISGKSTLTRHGVELALADLLHRDVIDDPELRQRVRNYLNRSDAIAVTTNGTKA